MAPDSSCGCATREWLTLQSSLVTFVEALDNPPVED